MLAPGLNVPTIVDVDGEHFAIEIAKFPMHLGQDEVEHVLAAMWAAGTVVEAFHDALRMNSFLQQVVLGIPHSSSRQMRHRSSSLVSILSFF